MSLLIILMILSGSVSDDFEFSINNVHSTYRVTGEFLGFEIDENVHPVISEDNSMSVSFWSTDSLLDYFLTLFHNETVTLTIQDADCTITESGEAVRLKIVIGATAGDLTFSHWRDSVQAEGDLQDVLGNYFRAPYGFRID